MNPTALYQQTTVETQSKGKLVVMLYEGAVKFLNFAIEAIEEGNIPDKAKYINKAQDIINELNAVLDLEAGGEIASNLRKLYMFMNRHLVEASLSKDVQKIKEVINLIEELNAGFKAIV